MSVHHISDAELTLEQLETLLHKGQKIALSDASKKAISGCREYLDQMLSRHKEPVYGINTGFGSLYNKSISHEDLEQLQKNLVMSHACGTGDEVPKELVRLMLVLKVQSLSYGKSGVQLSTVERLVDFYNHDILPVVYQQGSLGASGDLAPLAHLSLPLLGLGEVYYEGKKQKTEAVYKKLGWESLHLKSKEGLALLNGTQFMGAYGSWCLIKAKKLIDAADVIGAVSLDAFDGRIEPFSENIHRIRPHAGQLRVAENFRALLKGSEIITQKKQHVQDPYSFRCVPQVHGASRDALNYVLNVFTTENNSVTDNPTIFPEDDQVISGGNFHGQPLAIALDLLCIALSEIGNISERRTYQLISGLRGLPPFLVKNAGLNSGFMIPQYTAASIVSQNKQLCTPASADSIVSSNGQEDHVSMGANAATKAYKVVCNLERILAIELFNAAQAIEFRSPLKTSAKLEKVVTSYRKVVEFIHEDKIMHDEMIKSEEFIKSFDFTSLID
jgi:histidine ammonia-lyase